MARENLMVRTFVELADSLVDDFDPVELMSLLADRSVELLDASAAGLMLKDPLGMPRVLAASSEAAQILELFQLQAEQGPCLDVVNSGQLVESHDLATESRWPLFAREAMAAGFRSLCAVPMRLRASVIGGLNLFLDRVGGLEPPDVLVGQALADVATITILQDRVSHDATVLSEQLQTALNSRVVIEQAKGVLAERAGISVSDAFARLRLFARSSNRHLTLVAQDVIDGRLAGDLVRP